MLVNKNYPHTITLRKGFLGILAILFILIIIYIVNLIEKSSKENVNSKNQNGVIHKYANDNDFSWANNTNIPNDQKSLVTQPSPKSQLATKQANSVNNENVSIVNPQNNNGQDDKALSAPINSNLVPNDTSNSQANSSPTLPSLQNSTNNDDQNMQQEKKAFLQVSGQA